MKKSDVSYRLLSVLSVVSVILIWQFVIAPVVANYFLPPPTKVAEGFYELIVEKRTLPIYIVASLRRILLGWILGSAFAIPIGLFIGNSRIFKSLVDPWVHLLSFIPAIALLTIFIVWFGVGELSKVLLIMYATGFIVMINTGTGVEAIDEEKIRAAQTLGANRRQLFFHLTVPASVPSIYVGMRLAMRSSFLVIIASEMLAAESGLGYLIWNSRLYFKTSWMYAGIITLALVGFITDRTWRLAGNTIFKRYVREIGKY